MRKHFKSERREEKEGVESGRELEMTGEMERNIHQG